MTIERVTEELDLPCPLPFKKRGSEDFFIASSVSSIELLRTTSQPLKITFQSDTEEEFALILKYENLSQEQKCIQILKLVNLYCPNLNCVTYDIQTREGLGAKFSFAHS
jgi:hypothetical protein